MAFSDTCYLFSLYKVIQILYSFSLFVLRLNREKIAIFKLFLHFLMAEGFQELRSFPSLPDRFLHDLGLADNIVRLAFFVTFFLKAEIISKA